MLVCLISLPYVAKGFLLTKQTLWKKELILVRGRLVFWLVKNVFFSPFFRDFCQFFFCLVDTSFSKNALITAGENGFSSWGRPFSSVHKIFLPVEAVTEISGSQFLKKGHLLTNITDFLVSGNHFLSFFETTVNCCCQWKLFIVELEHIFRPILYFA